MRSSPCLKLFSGVVRRGTLAPCGLRFPQAPRPSFDRPVGRGGAASPSVGSFEFRSNRPFSADVFELPMVEKAPATICNPGLNGVFQYGFTNPEILTGFLNAVFTANPTENDSLPDLERVQGTEYLYKKVPKLLAKKKFTLQDALKEKSVDPRTTFDYDHSINVRCRTSRGRYFVVQLQHGGDALNNDFFRTFSSEHFFHSDDLGLHVVTVRQDAAWKSHLPSSTDMCQEKVKALFAGEPVREPRLVSTYEMRCTADLRRHLGDRLCRYTVLSPELLTVPAAEKSTPAERWAHVLRSPAAEPGEGRGRIQETKRIEDPDLVCGGDPALLAFIDRLRIEHMPPGMLNRYVRPVAKRNAALEKHVLEPQKAADEAKDVA